MKQVKIMVLSKRKIKENILICTASAIGIYLLISLYFMNHFFFRTEVNGVNVSLKSHNDVLHIFNNFIKGYELLLLERNGDTEIITSQDIGMQYQENSTLSQINHKQNPLLWISSLFTNNKYYVKDLYVYKQAGLDFKIDNLKCISGKNTEPQNVAYQYLNGSYEIIKESYGNKVNEEKFTKALKMYLLTGKTVLDLNKMDCYENPKYTINSKKALHTKNLLDKYVSAKIAYRFGNTTEQLDGSVIHNWLSVDENLDVIIDQQAVEAYVKALSKKYNTVGIKREFRSSTGKTIELTGGLYGWKINRDAEAEALLDNIKRAEVIEKEPVYMQKALSREGNEIGNTYIEINITRQHLWFYKDGKLFVQGSVVTGNPNRGNATVLGVYMVNYKQKDTKLTGPGYEAKVTYWMPFFGNMGLHDASWRSRFGGEIYKRNGSHGCVNAPIYLAKTIFENIEEGIPVIVYEEGQ